MTYNHVKFVKKMCDKYIDKYKGQIPVGIILDIIETTLITVPDSYFSYDMVQEHPEFCKQSFQSYIFCSLFPEHDQT